MQDSETPWLTRGFIYYGFNIINEGIQGGKAVASTKMV